MTYSQFLDYIDSKYEQDAANAGKTPYNYTKDTVYAYQKNINTTDNYTHDTTKNVVSIDQSTYNTLIPSTTTYTLPDGETCTIEITKNLVTLFDYEYDSNESKRNIKVLNYTYANQMEQTFQDLMSK